MTFEHFCWFEWIMVMQCRDLWWLWLRVMVYSIGDRTMVVGDLVRGLVCGVDMFVAVNPMVVVGRLNVTRIELCCDGMDADEWCMMVCEAGCLRLSTGSSLVYLCGRPKSTSDGNIRIEQHEEDDTVFV
jgi:hypothetical protein